jgi:hypothetical protein
MENGLQLWGVAAKVLNKQLRTNDKGKSTQAHLSNNQIQDNRQNQLLNKTDRKTRKRIMIKTPQENKQK